MKLESILTWVQWTTDPTKFMKSSLIMDNFNATARQKCLPQRVRITGIRRNVSEIVIMEKQIIIIMT